MITNDEVNRGKKYILFILSRRDYTKSEIIKKLNTRELSEKSILKVIKWLEENNYVNDESFAYSWAHYRVSNKPVGKFRLQRELSEKGISRNIREKVICDVFDEISEEELARKLVRQKIGFKDINFLNIEPKKIYNLLIRRGFSADIARDIFFELLNKEFN